MVDGLGDQGARDGDDSFLDQLLHPPERTDGASGVDRPNPARVAGAPSLEEIKRLGAAHFANRNPVRAKAKAGTDRSEEHASELQSLMRISYAVFCLKKKK